MRLLGIPADEKRFTLDGVTFRIECELIGLADLRANPAKDWRKSADHWRVRVFCADKPEPYATDYWTGSGHRKHGGAGLYARWKPGAGKTVAEQESSRPVHPSAKSVLYSLSSDCGIALNMPRDDAAAMDYLESEFGREGKASALLEQVRSLHRVADGLEFLFQGTGLTLQRFAEATEELDS